MGIIAQDTAATGGRGSGNPGAWNPGSDGNSYQAVIGASYTFGFSSNELTATGSSAEAKTPYTTITNQGNGIQGWVHFVCNQVSDNIGVFWANDGTANNYYEVVASGKTNLLLVQKAVAGTITGLGSFSFTLTATKKYFVKFQWNTDTTINAKVWDDSGSEPGWQITTAADSAFTSGRFGLRYKGNATGNSMSMDHFLIQTIPGGGAVHLLICDGYGGVFS